MDYRNHDGDARGGEYRPCPCRLGVNTEVDEFCAVCHDRLPQKQETATMKATTEALTPEQIARLRAAGPEQLKKDVERLLSSGQLASQLLPCYVELMKVCTGGSHVDSGGNTSNESPQVAEDLPGTKD